MSVNWQLDMIESHEFHSYIASLRLRNQILLSRLLVFHICSQYKGVLKQPKIWQVGLILNWWYDTDGM